jgi:hypothetical protein
LLAAPEGADSLVVATKVVPLARRSARRCGDAGSETIFESLPEDNMNAKLHIGAATCVVLFLSACGSGPQSLILGKWEVAGATVGGAEVVSPEAGRAIKMTAEFSGDGTAKITMFGQTVQGTYKLTGDELQWTVNGMTTKAKVNVTSTELDVTDDANRTVKYKRK